MSRTFLQHGKRLLVDGAFPGDAPRRNGFTILELLITMLVVGVLLATLIPLIGVTRETSRKLECHNHLKQLGFALHSYHSTQGSLPAGWRWDPERVSAFGWIPPLLPHLGQERLGALVHLDSYVGSHQNASARVQTPSQFLCPSDLVQKTFVLYAESHLEGKAGDVPLLDLPAASYIGVFGIQEPDDIWNLQPGRGAFCGEKPVRLEDVTSGLSNLLLVGERRASTIPSTWLGVDSRGEDAPCRILGNANLGPNAPNADECEFTSRHKGMSNFLLADGQVRSISDKIDAATYQRLATRDLD